jgi:succinoglycan biosynthesis protein ExoU
MTSANGVCVVIAARNASGTIARAVGSALREPEVAEVVAVDDGSADDTAAAARAADDGSGRLKILRLPENRGPAFARNHAIANSAAPLIAILDADDFFLQGRFARLLTTDDWDFVADNVVFVEEGRAAAASEPEVPHFEAAPRFLDVEGFVQGNISRRGASRGEIGFLKPVMRRAFLAAHGLRYREELRLGEDYDLYVRALLKGARYKIVHGCGYGAIVRPDSLSGRHRTLDLKRLYEADRALLAAADLPAGARAMLARHERHVRGRYELRHFLDVKAESGLLAAALHALGRPSALPAIVGGVAADKLEAFAPSRASRADAPSVRYLLPGRLAAQK